MTPLIALGDSGPAVVLLQQRLCALGLLDPSVASRELASGLFGPLTEQALRGFQEKRRRDPSGALDGATLIELDAAAPDAAAVTGRVVTATGVPVGGVEVVVRDRSGVEPQDVSRDETAPDGTYRLLYLPPSRGETSQPRRVIDVEVRRDGRPLATSAVVVGATGHEQIEIAVRAAGGRAAEFDLVSAALQAAAPSGSDKAPALAAALAHVPAAAGVAAIDASRLSQLAAAQGRDVSPSLLYALGRLGASTELEPGQADLHVAALLQTAADAGLVEASALGAGAREAAHSALAALDAARTEQLRDRYRRAADERPDDGGPTLRTVLSAGVPEPIVDRFLDTVATLRGQDPTALWHSVEADPELSPHARSLELTLAAATISRGTAAVVSRVVEGAAGDDGTVAAHLASLTREQWRALLDGVAEDELTLPVDVPVAPGQDTRDAFAIHLEKETERTYPTTFVSVRLGAESAPIRRFFTANPDLDLAHTAVEAADIAETDRDEVLSALRPVQRMIRLGARLDEARQLREMSLDSAFAIARLSPADFVTQTVDVLATRTDALAMHARAEATTAASLHLLTDLLGRGDSTADDLVGARNTATTEPGLIDQRVLDYVAMFGSLDMCACSDCQSVFSPAAYLVDLLGFLGDRRPAGDPGTTYLTALLKRRPDLEHTLLTCDNTTVSVPHIDLVIEMLERRAAPQEQAITKITPTAVTVQLQDLAAKQGVAIELDAELVADPTDPAVHYVLAETGVLRIDAADPASDIVTIFAQTAHDRRPHRLTPPMPAASVYDVLAKQSFPWELPFDLGTETAWALLAIRGIELADFLRHFGLDPVAPAVAPWVNARLGLAPRRGEILANVAVVTTADLWGESAGPAADWASTLVTNLPALLHRCGLTLEQLEEVLALPRIVALAPAIAIAPTTLPDGTRADGCDLASLTVIGLSDAEAEPVLRALHDISVLRRGLGWSFDAVAAALELAAPSGSIDAAALATIADLASVVRRYALDPATVLAWLSAGDPDPQGSIARIAVSEFERIYATGAVPEVSAAGNREPLALKTDAATGRRQPALVTAASVLDAELRPLVTAALQLTDDDIDALTDLGPGPDFSGFATAAAWAALSRRSGVALPQLSRLARLGVIDAAFSSPDKLGEALDRFDLLARRHIDAAELDYAAGGAQPELAPEPDVLAALVTDLASAQAATSAYPAPTDPGRARDLALDALRAELPLVGWKGADSDSLLTGLADEVNATVPSRAATFFDVPRRVQLATSANVGILKIPANLADRVSFSPRSGVLTVAGYLDADELTLLRGLSPEKAFATAVDAVTGPGADAFLPGTSTADLIAAVGNARRHRRQQLVVDLVGRFVALSTDVVRELLTGVSVNDAAPPRPLLDALCSTDAPLLPDRLNAILRGMHRVAVFATPLAPQAEDAWWWTEHVLPAAPGVSFSAVLAGDPAPPAPAALAALALDIAACSDVSATWGAPLSSVARVVWGIVPPVASPMALPSLGESLRRLFGEAVQDADIATIAGAATTLTFLELAEATAMLRLAQALGASLTECASWADNLTASVSDLGLRIEALYGADAWAAAATAALDELRRRRRDALLAYLVRAGQVTRPADLSVDLLIDVEMDSCQDTTRIRAALNSIQSFVMRCQMGLEGSALRPDPAADPAWKQWEYLGGYRTWEAPRRIFVNPENWLDSDTRQGKSVSFTQLEADLLQTDLSEPGAEDAFLACLDRLSEISRPDVQAFYREREVTADGRVVRDVLHVVARTPQPPHKHFYRTCEGGIWSPWEPVGSDIDSSHAALVVWNRRLYLFWLVSLPPTADTSTTTTKATEYEITNHSSSSRVQLAWSERRNGKWQPKRLSPPDVVIEVPVPMEHVGIYVYGEGEELLLGITGPFWLADASAFRMGGFAFRPGSVSRLIEGVEHLKTAGIAPKGLSYVWNKVAGRNLTLGTQETSFPLLATPTGTIEATMEARARGLDVDSQFFARDRTRSFFVQSVGTTRGPRAGEALGYVERPGWYTLSAGETRQLPLVLPTTAQLDERRARLGAAADDLHIPLVSPAGPATMIDTVTLPTGAAQLLNLGGVHAQAVSADQSTNAFAALSPRMVLDALPTLLSPMPSTGADTSAAGMYDKGIFGLLHDTVPHVTFTPFYHPYVDAMLTTLQRDGIPGMVARNLQLHPADFQPAPNTGVLFPFSSYGPSPTYVAAPFPTEEIDFSADGAYSSDNWDLFCHAHYLVASRLLDNGQYEGAQRWLHHLYEPGARPDPAGAPPQQAVWQTKPFYLRAAADYQHEEIGNLLRNGADPSLRRQVAWWRTHPFDPHAIASLRTTAYQKAIFMRYLDVLIGWIDSLMIAGDNEKLSQAGFLADYADRLLKEKPVTLAPRFAPRPRTPRTLKADFSAFSDAIVAAESLIGTGSDGTGETASVPAPLLSLPSILYFSIPRNEKLLAYWDTVADRQFKLRHCQDLDGRARVDDLWGARIDPGQIARMMAAGMSLTEALGELAAPTPRRRFRAVHGLAVSLARQAGDLGTQLLAVLEKGDAERLAALRATHEIDLLQSVTTVRAAQETAAESDWEAAISALGNIDQRAAHYQSLLSENGSAGPAADEKRQLDKLDDVSDQSKRASWTQATASVLFAVPQAKLGPFIVGAEFGGQQLGHLTSAAATLLSMGATSDSGESSKSGIRASNARRRQEWEFQHSQAVADSLHQTKIAAGAIARLDAAKAETANHADNLERSRAVHDLLTSKFTRTELYSWMARQISTTYRQTYDLAFRVAREAELSWQRTLLRDDTFLTRGAWDSERKGLLAANTLVTDLMRMEVAYDDYDDRMHELVKPISLRLLDPARLTELIETGTCSFILPEWLYDLDCPGHYQRRIHSVAVTIPCVVGPYATVNARLELVDDLIRVDPTLAGGAYAFTGASDSRFQPSGITGGSIVTSTGQADTGLFDPTGADDRLRPFEGAGAISRWVLTLDRAANSFDTNTVTDVILTTRYTARYSAQLAKAARTHTDAVLGRASTEQATALPALGLADEPTQHLLLIDLRAEQADVWERNRATPTPFRLELSSDRLPYVLRRSKLTVAGLELYLHPAADAEVGPAAVGVQMGANAWSVAAPDRPGGGWLATSPGAKPAIAPNEPTVTFDLTLPVASLAAARAVVQLAVSA